MEKLMLSILVNQIDIQHNSYQMTEIKFLKDKQSYYAIFQFPDELLAKNFYQYIRCTMAICIAEMLKVEFLVQHREDFPAKNNVVCKGNIAQVIDFLIADEVIAGKTQFILQDKEETDIRIFLDESKKCNTFISQPNKMRFNDSDFLMATLFSKNKSQENKEKDQHEQSNEKLTKVRCHLM